MTTTTLTPTLPSRAVRRAGAWCLGGGILGAAEGVVVLAWSPQVPDDRFSYPFSGLWYFVSEVSFVVQHMLLVAGGVALLWLPAVILAPGVYVFVALTPAINGSFVAGRLGIGGWMLLFAALGYGLTRLETRDA
jgi:hypothetical protein